MLHAEEMKLILVIVYTRHGEIIIVAQTNVYIIYKIIGIRLFCVGGGPSPP